MFVTDGGNNLTGWGDPHTIRCCRPRKHGGSGGADEDSARHGKNPRRGPDADCPHLFLGGMSLYYPDKVGGFEPNFVDDHRWGEFFIPEGKK